jgi:hypothetical protein
VRFRLDCVNLFSLFANLSVSGTVRVLAKASRFNGGFSMPVSFIALAAAAAAQAAAPQSGVKSTSLGNASAPTAAVAPAPAPAPVIAPAAPVATIVSAPMENVLRAGTEVPLRVEEGLDSNNKGIREGQQFHLAVANNVMLGGVVVIPAGSPATAEITDLRRKGMWGKSARPPELAPAAVVAPVAAPASVAPVAAIPGSPAATKAAIPVQPH